MNSMSTRSTTHFVNSSFSLPEEPNHLFAIIYRHNDGYPEGAGTDIIRFLEKCKKLDDDRLTDASYLSARYVAFLAQKFGDVKSLDFRSVGICMSDPVDIDYRYIVDCGRIGIDGLPLVQCFDMRGNQHDIPRPR